MYIINFVFDYMEKIVKIFKKLIVWFFGTELYDSFKRKNFIKRIHKNAKKLLALKKSSSNSLEKTEEFECLFKKFCADIGELKNNIYASTMCAEQRAYLMEMVSYLNTNEINKVPSFKKFYSNYRNYVIKSAECSMYNSNSTYNEHLNLLLVISRKFYKNIAELIIPLYSSVNEEEKNKIKEKLLVKG